jgi:hypothetical protein
MILAELEVYHSRPVAPTRRVALGTSMLPVDPPPGFGGILLGGIVANYVGAIDPDFIEDLTKLTTQVEHGMRVPQPRLRYRFQRDTVGLQRSRSRLLGHGDELTFSFDGGTADPAQQILGAVYAAGELPLRVRGAVMGTIRRGIGWQGPIGPELIAALAGFDRGSSRSAHALSHPVEWALEVLEFGGVAPANGGGANGSAAAAASSGPTSAGAGPGTTEIQRRYRQLLIEAHPDHGGDQDSAAQRIADLTEARRILLG